MHLKTNLKSKILVWIGSWRTNFYRPTMSGEAWSHNIEKFTQISGNSRRNNTWYRLTFSLLIPVESDKYA